MRDPRLAEIEFLSAVEGQPEYLFNPNEANGARFGLSDKAMREMVFELIDERLVNGPAFVLASGGSKFPAMDLASATNADLKALCGGGVVRLRITHKGRVHIWRRRDELRADREREQFGILFDRRAWDRELAVQLVSAAETNPVSVLFLDVDHFKTVNDTLGHDEGDRVLKRFFELIRDIVGARGDAYRYGGDEVAVMLSNTECGPAEEIAERVRSAVEAEFREQRVAVTTSIGVASFAKPLAPTDAFNVVDKALYEAKRMGKNRVVVA